MCDCACMYEYHIHTWYLWKSEEGMGFLGTGFTDDCKISHGDWESNQVLCKCNRCSLVLIHLSNPSL